ncbi:MAG TPA: sulfur carrier protein ThiS [Gemmatimonadales bacterium]|nr:sulfur carrier protein ThiS [Gemmatimonadales bacterium]
MSDTATESLDIVVNGEPRRVPGPATLDDLLRHLGLDPRGVVVEHNRRVVRRPQLAETPLAAGDSIELVHFVGGG